MAYRVRLRRPLVVFVRSFCYSYRSVDSLIKSKLRGGCYVDYTDSKIHRRSVASIFLIRLWNCPNIPRLSNAQNDSIVLV